MALCLIPSSELQKLDFPEIDFGDLVGHFIMFLIFSIYLLSDLKKYTRIPSQSRKPLILALSICIFLGILTEILQLLITSLNRDGSIADFLFDCAGSGLGISVTRFIKKKPDSVT